MALKRSTTPHRSALASSRSRSKADLKSTLTLSTETPRVMRAPSNPALRLPFGLLVRSAISGRQYRVGEPLGSGGFGAVYRVGHVAGGEQLPTKCVLKVASEPRAWHREAYFGDLFKDESASCGSTNPSHGCLAAPFPNHSTA